jgi:DNA-binding NarL/FixJ family response regulator
MVIQAPKPIRILIADDHPMMRAGLRDTLERQPDLEVVAEADDGIRAIALFREYRPALTLMDLQMPVMDGYGAIKGIHAIDPEAIIVALTTYAGDARVGRALSAGAASYLLKTASSTQIVAVLRRTLAGESVTDDTVAGDVAARAEDDSLTHREISVLQLMAVGFTNADIANTLHVSEETIKARAKRIFSKLAAKDRTHAVAIGRKRGFIDC